MPTKKKTEEITDSIMEAQNETEEQNTAPPAAEEQIEKPKRTRKKKTEITETEEQPVNETVEPQTEEPADEEAAAEPVKPRSRILTVEAKTEVYTEQTRADIIWHEIQNAYITHRIMTGTLSGVECNDAGHHYAIADYNGFRILIPLKEMFFDFPTNLHGDEYKEAVMRYNKLMNSMLGAEIDFVVRGIDSKARSVVASRKEAMYKKRQTFYMETDENGMFHIYEDRIVQARVTAVAEKAIRVEIFGVDCAINIIKHSDDGSTKIETPEAGAEFEVFLKSAGSYASSKKSERDKIKTDKYGFAETKPLPYGVYTVKQVSGSAGAERINPFDVYINADGEAYRYIINNAAFKAFIDIVKKDATTGKVIPAAGVGFKVKNLATGKFLVQHINYPTPMDIDVFYTDSNGRLRLPEKLSYGDYAVIEQCTAEGYILDSEPVKFTVDGTQDTVTVEKLNYPQMGTLTVTKEGEIFSSVHEKDGLYIPKYETAGLKNAEFSVFAAEDIYTPDGTLRCAKGEKADSIITGEDGKAATKPLFLGKYEIRETKAPNGYVLTNEPVYAELKYAGQEVKITSTAVSVNNKRQKAVIRLRKHLEKDEIFNLGNTSEYTNIKFGLFATERLTAADGSEIPADGLLEVISVDENGNGIFTADIPVGAKLYVKETATDGHYILSDEKYPVEFTYSGQDISSVQLVINGGKAIENRIIRGRIDGIKTDEDLNPIGKAVFGLFKPDETVFTESTALAVTESEENGAFSFTGIPYGKWIIKELSCPDRYVLSDKLYEVDITEDGEVLSLGIQNKTVTGTVRVIKLSKADISRKLHGAEFYIYSDTDNNGVFDPNTDIYIGRLEETENGVYSLSKLKFGGYFLYENKAPDGYEKDDRYFYFQIKKDGETVTVENEKGVGFVNEPIPVPEVPSSPKTGDISNPLVFIIIGLSELFVSAASLIILKKKSGKE